MNISGLLQSAHYLIMNALLYPVMALLIFLVVAVLFLSGGFISELAFRGRREPDADRDSEELAAQVSKDILLSRFEAASGHIKMAIEKGGAKGRLMKGFMNDLALQIGKGRENLDIRTEKLIQQCELEVSSRLDKVRIISRIGPMLGLMGTLIPMGPALIALTSGDLNQMADCLIIAFGTTVSGMATGAAAYVISIVRERWYSQDMRDMEYLADLITGGIEKDASTETVTDEDNIAVFQVKRG